jgi:uncharacterized membrane protein HdeD (DUF308 family)
MLDTLTRYWWAVAVRGVVAVLFGLMALVWPDVTVLVLVLLFGAYSLVDGVFGLVSAVLGDRSAMGNRAWLAVESVAGVLIGVVTFAWPQATTLVLLWLIAAWAVVTGVVEVVAAVRLRREIQGEWVLALSGVLSVLFGIALVAWPATGALALVTLIGAFAIVYGLALVMLSLRLRRLRSERTVPGTDQPAAA